MVISESIIIIMAAVLILYNNVQCHVRVCEISSPGDSEFIKFVCNISYLDIEMFNTA